MQNIRLFYLILYLCIPCYLIGEIDSYVEKEDGSSLLQDLVIVDYWNQKLNETFPVTYNHLLQGGYFSMPSARMSTEGEVGVGYGYIPPYIHYNFRFQIVDFLELTGSYRIFKGVEDPVLTRFGFGDFSDKGANLKLSLFSPEDSHYALPGLAIGLEDFIGTSAFKAYYVVLTKIFLQYNLEFSVGYGMQRFDKWFGGAIWMPFRNHNNRHLHNLAIVIEYDSIPYWDIKLEKHPKGRIKNTPWHVGLKYRMWGAVDLSVSYIRGDKFACTLSTFYNFGDTKGLLPKIHDILPYRAPSNYEEIGYWRPFDVMVQEFNNVLDRQGFSLSKAWIENHEGNRILRLRLINAVYREERLLRIRLEALLSALLPANIDEIIVELEVLTLPVQELHYKASFLRAFREKEIGKYELEILSPFREVSRVNPYTSRVLFEQEKEWWNLELLPKVQTLFGSSKGKFKYALGLSVALNGFLFNETFYSILLGYYFLTDMRQLNDVDRLNPSQLINVRTNMIRYYQTRDVTVDEAYLQRMWNLGCGRYSRIALGYLERAYGGVAVEFLYYPVSANWAVGIEVALLKRRSFSGLGFTGQIRKLQGFKPYHEKFLGTQAFVNLYYDWKRTGLHFKVNAGKFLAHDYGVRTEVSRYFPSGLQLGFWYTYTNAKDIINSQNYHDKGFFFTVPLDIFYTKTSRSRWGYGMSAWLRDVGVSAITGTQLYDLINQERR
jgi:hypothetical protein